MKLHTRMFASLIVVALFGGGAMAQQRNTAHDTRHVQEHADAVSAMGLQRNPFVPVYIVTSRETYQDSLQPIARNGVGRRDGAGRDLVVAEVKAHQLAEVSHRIHARELRCGGFFAFKSRAEADAFIRSDRTAQAMRASLVDYTIDNQATVGPWLTQVQEANIYDTIDHLSTAWPSRYYDSTHGRNAAIWIRSTWLALAAGRNDVTIQLSSCNSCATQPSVILTIIGAELPDEIVVLGGHLDSISSSGDGDNMDAPGADDDASGIATLTEVLRVAMASGWKPRRTVKFMGYAAEETGLNGSNAIAQTFQSQGQNVVGVLQLDMTEYRVGGTDMRVITDFSNASMKLFLANLFDEYLAPSGLTRGTYTCGYGCSDHASWTSAGYPSAMMFEGGANGYNPNIHTPDDTLAAMGDSAANSVKFAKLGLAFLGELGKTAVGANAPPVANFSFTASGLTASFTGTSTDSDGTITSRSWDFGDGGTSTATNPSHTYAAAGTYNVALTVTDDDGATDSTMLPVIIDTCSGGGVLSDGVPVNSIACDIGSAQFWTMVVPTGASNLSFKASGGSGDYVVYVKRGSAPTTSTFDCKQSRFMARSCSFAAPQPGTYHVMLYGRSAYSGVSLVGNYDGGGGSQLHGNTVDHPIVDNATVESSIKVSGRKGNASNNALISVNIASPYRGDLQVDLVSPDGSVHVLHNRAGGSADDLIATYRVDLSSEALNGEWKLRVTDNAAGDVGHIDRWSITF